MARTDSDSLVINLITPPAREGERKRMTKKDFEIIAQILSCTKIQDKVTITKLLKSTNPRFDPEKFWKRVEDWR